LDTLTSKENFESIVISLTGKDLSSQWWNGYNFSFKMTPNEQWDLDPKVVQEYLITQVEGEF
jgi:hypothetical protein